MTEKQASSEIAQSRERFEKWAINGDWEEEDWEKLFAAYHQAERDTRERLAKLLEAEAKDADRKFMPTTRNALKAVAERIRGKE